MDKKAKKKQAKQAEQKEQMEKEYLCPVCYEKHMNHTFCPVVKQRLLKSGYNKKESNIMLGIVLQCFEKDVSFVKLWKEISYILFMAKREEGFLFFNLTKVDIYPPVRIINPDFIVRYASTVLECKTSDLTNIKKTDERLEKLFDSFWDVVSYGTYDRQTIEFKDGYMGIYGDIFEGCTFYCDKVKSRKRNKYILSMNVHFKIKEGGFDDTLYSIISKDECTGQIYLYSSYEGTLKDLFEMNYDWMEGSDELYYNDSRFSIWTQKLSNATKNDLINWKKFGVSNDTQTIEYTGTYEDKVVVILLNQIVHMASSPDITKNYLYVQQNEFISFCFTDNYEIDYMFEDKNEITECHEKEPLLLDLHEEIVKSIQRRENFKENKKTYKADIIIKKTDVIVITYSYVCRNLEHFVTHKTGSIKLLKDGELIDYLVYLGYCRSCPRLMMFLEDYKEMLKHGIPQCTIIDINGKKLTTSNFDHFNAESILRQRGYSTKESQENRINILQDVIDSKTLSVHEVLEYLNWFIRIHKQQKRMKNACSIWESDKNFVIEKYCKDDEVVEIDRIIN